MQGGVFDVHPMLMNNDAWIFANLISRGAAMLANMDNKTDIVQGNILGDGNQMRKEDTSQCQ